MLSVLNTVKNVKSPSLLYLITCGFPSVTLMIKNYFLYLNTYSVICSVMSNSLQPHGLQPTSSSFHGILRSRVLEWVAIPFSRKSS